MNETLKFAVEIAPLTLIIAVGVTLFAALVVGLNVRMTRLAEVIKRKDFSFAPKHSERDGSLQWAKPVYDCWAGTYVRG